MNTRTVGELFQTRRDLLKLGGLGLLGASVDSVWPLKMAAAEGAASKVQPRGNARNVLFYEISGAISHVEGFDFKENPGTPKDQYTITITGTSGSLVHSTQVALAVQ